MSIKNYGHSSPNPNPNASLSPEPSQPRGGGMAVCASLRYRRARVAKKIEATDQNGTHVEFVPNFYTNGRWTPGCLVIMENGTWWPKKKKFFLLKNFTNNYLYTIPEPSTVPGGPGWRTAAFGVREAASLERSGRRTAEYSLTIPLPWVKLVI